MPKLLKDLPVGSKVRDLNTKIFGAPIDWIVGEHNHFGRGQTVLISEKILMIASFDAKEASGGGNRRDSSGNSNYAVSNLDQWLNSDKEAGEWWSATHEYDQPPTLDNIYETNEYASKPGFLNGFSKYLKEALIETEIPYYQPPNEGGTKINMKRKVFIPSVIEVNAETNSTNQENEGAKITYFMANESVAYPTAEAVANSKYKTSSLSTSRTYQYWLRSYYSYSSSYSDSSLYVKSTTTNSKTNCSAYDSANAGIRPVININSEIYVSDNQENGAYIIDWTKISTQENLGEQEKFPFDISYNIESENEYTICINLNGNKIDEPEFNESGSYKTRITYEMVNNFCEIGENLIELIVSKAETKYVKTIKFYIDRFLVNDEILEDEPSYQIKDGDGRVLYDNVKIEQTTKVIQAGTPLNKNFFKEVVRKKKLIASFMEPGTYVWDIPENINNVDVFIMGGGGSGDVFARNNSKIPSSGNKYGVAIGGYAGEITNLRDYNIKGKKQINIVIGDGGKAAISEIGTDTLYRKDGNPGGTSSFDGNIARGGSANGQIGSSFPVGSSNTLLENLEETVKGASGGMGGSMPSYWHSGNALHFSQMNQAINPNEPGKKYGSAGATSHMTIKATSSFTTTQSYSKVIESNCGCGGTEKNIDATGNGCGGAGVVKAFNPNSKEVIYSGAGSPGMVLIYA